MEKKKEKEQEGWRREGGKWRERDGAEGSETRNEDEEMIPKRR